jgi:hypothetical protein
MMPEPGTFQAFKLFVFVFMFVAICFRMSRAALFSFLSFLGLEISHLYLLAIVCTWTSPPHMPTSMPD